MTFPPKPDIHTYRRTDIGFYRVASLLKTTLTAKKSRRAKYYFLLFVWISSMYLSMRFTTKKYVFLKLTNFLPTNLIFYNDFLSCFSRKKFIFYNNSKQHLCKIKEKLCFQKTDSFAAFNGQKTASFTIYPHAMYIVQ